MLEQVDVQICTRNKPQFTQLSVLAILSYSLARDSAQTRRLIHTLGTSVSSGVWRLLSYHAPKTKAGAVGEA